MIPKGGERLYWAYVDYDEKIHIKRYRDDRAIRNAQDSATTIGIFDPFYARDIKHAAEIVLEKYREVRYTVKPEAKSIIV